MTRAKSAARAGAPSAIERAIADQEAYQRHLRRELAEVRVTLRALRAQRPPSGTPTRPVLVSRARAADGP